MKLQKQDRLREMQLAFIGKLMADLSHELKNHLAIIKESSGLIEDLLLLQEPGQPADSERYQKIISVISERIAQAAEMCRFLSGFSHRMDQSFSSFNAMDVLQEEIYLLLRLARQKQVDLSSSFAEDLPALFNDPSLLQFAIYCIVGPALEALEVNGRILISVDRQDTSVRIVISTAGPMKDTGGDVPWHDILPGVLQMLEADFSRRINQDGNEEIAMIIPSIENPQKNGS